MQLFAVHPLVWEKKMTEREGRGGMRRSEEEEEGGGVRRRMEEA